MLCGWRVEGIKKKIPGEKYQSTPGLFFNSNDNHLRIICTEFDLLLKLPAMRYH